MRKWGALCPVIPTQELLTCAFNSVYEHPAESVGSFSETLSSDLFYAAAWLRTASKNDIFNILIDSIQKGMRLPTAWEDAVAVVGVTQ